MISNLYELEREVMYGGLMQSTLTMDATKITESIKVLLQEFKNVQFTTTTLQADIMMVKGTLETVRAENEINKKIIRKMGKDYPELVLAHPEFFTNDEKNNIL